MRRPAREYSVETSSALKETTNKFQNNKTVEILGVPVDVLTRAELETAFLEILKSQERGWISYVNVHTIDIANQIPWYKQFVKDALIRYCDGEGLSFGAFLLGKHIPERITLSDYIYDLAESVVEHKLTLFMLGGTQVVVELAAKKLKELYPSIKLSGHHHGYFSKEENNSMIDKINECKPDILLLGMGVPKQEEWTKQNFDKLNAKIIWMGGGFLDTLSGTKKRCPYWLGRIGFEWIFRFMQEPRRLWKRYLIGNPMYILRILRARLSRH